MIRARLATILVAVSLFGVTACSATAARSSTDGAASASPRTVTDPSGQQVVIPANASRVFGMYTTDLDYAVTLELGLAPVQAIRQGSVGFPDFVPQDKLAGIEKLVNYPDPQFEKIAAATPDVIVNGLGYEGGPDAKKLQAIAPTFTYDGFDGDWRDDFRALGQAFGKEAVAEAFLQRVDARTADVKATAATVPGGPPTVAYGYFDPSGSGGFVGTSNDNLNSQIFNQVGLRHSKAVGKKWTELSQERIADLADVDLLMIAVETDTDATKTLDQVREHPVWSKLPAVSAGHLVAVNNELSYASPHAHLAFLDVLEKDLGALATGG